MSQSILDAIREGNWSYEPEPVDEDRFDSTPALPGSGEKVDTMAKRAIAGLPLWHSNDRLTYDQFETDAGDE